MSVAVLGAGAFGTALAIALAQQGPVTLWGRSIGALTQTRENRVRLPGHPFPDQLSVTADLANACQSDTLLLAIPTQRLRAFATENSAALADKNLIACCKGIEQTTGRGPVSILTEVTGNAHPALLTGPSFAIDIAAGLPTALVLACADDGLGQSLQQDLTTATLRVYRTTDTTGAELGGALKNVIAIACGVAMGAGLGESARAALMTRGYAEMQRLAAALGAQGKTLSGLSGFGDLTLTCTSSNSRNYRMGLAIGAGTALEENVTVEGASTAHATHVLATQLSLEMPITSAVAGLVAGDLDVHTAMHRLLTRPLKEE